MKKLFLIYGGKSQEHDISILTAANISKALDYNTYAVYPIYIAKDGIWHALERLNGGVEQSQSLVNTSDETVVLPSILKQENVVAFPVLHGPNGEDGTIQGLFEMLDIAYVGAGVLASACGMDKIISKKIFAQAGIPQVPYVEVFKRDYVKAPDTILQRCANHLTFPMFVKPANLGSSVGVTKVETLDELYDAITLALTYDKRVVVEQGVHAREVEVAILGNNEPKASVVGEVIKAVDFYDFEEKYKNGNASLKIPADIDDAVSEKIRQYAIQAYEALDGTGLTRCDFFLTENNTIFINEVNTLPGFTQFSMYPLLWEASGLSYKALVNELLQLAIERYEEKKEYQKIH